MNITYSKKLEMLPPYLFIEIDKKKKAALDRKVDIISLGVGDPDLPTPSHIVKSGQEALARVQNHQYPFGAGLRSFRETVSSWFSNRFGVKLNPESEIYALLGSKEGIGHFPLAFVNPGDVVLIPEPGYPVYNAGTIFSGGTPYFMPLLESNGFLPDLAKIPENIRKKAKIIFINYPNNPTAAIAPKAFFKEVIEFALKYNIIVAHDAAYSEIYFEEQPISFLSVPGANEVGVEFHSLSKTFNMTGWRVGWACGNARIIKGLGIVKDNYDSGVFQAIQEAGITALSGPQDCVEDMRKVYRERRDVIVDGLNSLGWQVAKPKAAFYVWAKVPKGYTSAEAVGKLLDEAGIVSTPGNGMGPSGEGYVRFALTVPAARIKEAVQRIKNLKWK
jgi:LL-diaminopimelate aminotransferase